MPSTYTTNLGIEKIATGEQSGTWGTTTNTNFDLIDSAVNGIVSITLSSTGTSGSPNALPITDGTASNGRNKFIEFTDGGDLGGTAYVQLTPNDAEKVVHIRNSLSGSGHRERMLCLRVKSRMGLLRLKPLLGNLFREWLSAKSKGYQLECLWTMERVRSLATLRS